MTIPAGGRRGPYELLSRIGAGGMGEVWRARDTRLGRMVAVKILPPDLTADAEMRIRFAREAKAISQLDHPHICTLFDVGDDYLVMELLAGESLAERLGRGPLPLNEVLRYGVQIADALDQAHRAGIVHRDLKPANVMITKAGAKLLDFGIAKAMQARDGGSTAHQRVTQDGFVMGTVEYMAPEQLEDADVDTRADIFALGDLLYEMTTGQLPFQGRTRAAQIAAILSSEPPPIRELQPLAPESLEHVIRKCLEKDPEERWQSARDIATELRWITHSASHRSAAAIPPGNHGKWLARLTAVAVSVAMLAAAVWLVGMRRGSPAEVVHASIVVEDKGLQLRSGPPALSPDGRWLAYAAGDASGKCMLWVRSLRDGTSRRLAGTEEASAPFWSPDGRFIAFGTTSFLRKVPAEGGSVENIVTAGEAARGTWNRNNVILFNTGLPGAPLYRLSATGGQPAAVLSPASIGATYLHAPSFLPDGNHFLVLALGDQLARQGREGIWAGSLDGKTKPRFVVASWSNAAYVAPGILLFVRDRVLRAQRFDTTTLAVTGEADPIAPVQVFAMSALFAASGPDLLVYQPDGGDLLAELMLKNRKGEVLRKIGQPAAYWSPQVAPDGRRIVVNIGDDLWIVDMTDSTSTRFTFEALLETSPVWSSRGNEILYSLGGASAMELLRKPLGGKPVSLTRELPKFMIGATDWSSDGNYVAALRYVRPDSDMVLWCIPEQKWIELAATPGNETAGTFSPDDRWIAYQSDETGRPEIYVQPVPPNGVKHQVSTGGGLTPRWTPRGEIAYVDRQGQLAVVKVETTPVFRSGLPEALFPVELPDPMFSQFDVTPTGDFLVNVFAPEPPRPMTLVVNWSRHLQHF